MKKYNLSKIMKRAWELVKTAGANISGALKKAWEEAKNMVEEIITLNVVWKRKLYSKYKNRRNLRKNLQCKRLD